IVSGGCRNVFIFFPVGPDSVEIWEVPLKSFSVCAPKVDQPHARKTIALALS
ncbi:hypothetical protein NPIL_59611, partial [Nephila pilipes]